MAKRFIHISLDEKFVNSAIDQFESAYPDRNAFYVVVKQATITLRHTQEPHVKKITRLELLPLAVTIGLDDIVVFHSLPPIFNQFLGLLDKRTKTIWLCYGFEVYNDACLFSHYKLLGEHTMPHYHKHNQVCPSRLQLYFRRLLRKVNPKLPFLPIEMKQQAFERIDYIGTSFKEEYDHILQLTKITKPLITYWHYPLELIVDVEEPVAVKRRHVLIGNSAAITNNHLDVFEILKHLNYKDFESVTVPLNYGRDYHTTKVEEVGSRYFENSFNPLKDFMDLDTYNSILKQCGIAIFYNKRQQAIGTTIAMLWFGAKVYLSELNPFYHYLKRKQVIVFSVDTDLKNDRALTFLEVHHIQANRDILKSILSKKVLHKDLLETLSKIQANNL